MKNIVDLHTHTLFSRHAYSSLSENLDYALSIGLKYFGSSDHQPDKVNVGAQRDNFANISPIPDELCGMKILKGIEINCGPNFKNFFKDRSLVSKLDYGIASFHTYDFAPFQDKEIVTNYYLEACNNDLVKIIGHIDDGRFPCDYYKVINEAKIKNKLIEINNSSLNGRGVRVDSVKNTHLIIQICKELQVPVLLNSDAHIKYDIGNVDLAYIACKENNLSDELIVNTNIELLENYFKL